MKKSTAGMLMLLAILASFFYFSSALALEFNGPIGDIALGFGGDIYVSTKLSENATDGDIFQVAMENNQLRVVSSLRANGFPKWDSFSQMAFTGQFGYVLGEYPDSCGAVFSPDPVYLGGLSCQISNYGKSITSGQGKIFIGWGADPNFHIQVYAPLGSGELDWKANILPDGVPEKLFFQEEKSRLFSAMGEAGIGIWSLEGDSLWKLGVRTTFFSEDEYDNYTKAIDVIAEGQYVYALASDRFGWEGVLAIIDLPSYNYNSNWFQFAPQVGALDITGRLVFLKKSGNRICVGTAEEILLIDASDPTSPRLIRKISGVFQDVEFFEGNLLLAEGNALRFVLWDEVLKGDISGDGKVDLGDAILALRVVSGKPVTETKKENSINGKIGLPDAIHALQKAAGLR